MANHKIIKNHRLNHIKELIVDPEIFLQRFNKECGMCNCNGSCCREGVLLDIQDKEKILAHADLIKKYLEPQQQSDVSKWFDNKIQEDIDFPSGKCDGTAVHNGGCVFLDSKGLCCLQKTAMAQGWNKFSIKPFFCVAFPLVIDTHVLTTDDPEFTGRKECCCTDANGPLTVLDVCREEFEYILGADGLKEIEQMFEEYSDITK